MSPRANALRVVAEEPEYVPGDPSLTAETMSLWREGQRRCRARRRHNWQPQTVREYKHHYEVLERCSHCMNRRVADYNKMGRKITKWQMIYRDNYLLPHGAQRITDDLQDELSLGDILSRRIIEAPDDEDD